QRELMQARESARLDVEDADENLHALALSLESKRTTLTALEAALARAGSKEDTLRARQADLQRQREEDVTPVETFEAEQQQWFARRLEIDKQLAAAREALEQANQRVRELETQY